MSKYNLYHLKSKNWVSQLLINYGDYEYDEPYISNLKFEDEKEYAKTFDNDKSFPIPSKLEEDMGLRRVYTGKESYRFFSPELNAWLEYIDGGTLFEAWKEWGHDVYPAMHFRAGNSSGLIIRDKARIEWLKENTKLEAVRVDE